MFFLHVDGRFTQHGQHAPGFSEIQGDPRWIEDLLGIVMDYYGLSRMIINLLGGSAYLVSGL